MVASGGIDVPGLFAADAGAMRRATGSSGWESGSP
jgi:hypothetical protein